MVDDMNNRNIPIEIKKCKDLLTAIRLKRSGRHLQADSPIYRISGQFYTIDSTVDPEVSKNQ
jgi:hypothetical protein